MAETLKPLRRHNPPKPRPRINAGSLLALAMLVRLDPRLWILGFWIFSYGLDEAFSSWLIPAAGFIPRALDHAALRVDVGHELGGRQPAGSGSWSAPASSLDLMFLGIATRLAR